MNLEQVNDAVKRGELEQRRQGYEGKLVVLISQSLFYNIGVEFYQSAGDRQGDTIAGHKIVAVQHINDALVSVVPEWLVLGLIRDTAHSLRASTDNALEKKLNSIWSGE